jgi:methionyl aminopeptidase
VSRDDIPSRKAPFELDLMRRAGKIVGEGHRLLRDRVRPGMTTLDLDAIFEKHVRDSGAVPTFKGYRGFPASLCVSINEEIVHGIPSAARVLKEGDLLKLDAGATYKGYVGDAAVTVGVGSISAKAQRLLDATREALMAGIAEVGPGKGISRIGRAVQTYAEAQGYSVVEDYVGHGIGAALHEAPQVPNYVISGFEFILQAGHCIAIEPMLNEGRKHTRRLDDEWTVVTRDGSLSAHFEHTVAVTKDGYEILTLA